MVYTRLKKKNRFVYSFFPFNFFNFIKNDSNGAQEGEVGGVWSAQPREGPRSSQTGGAGHTGQIGHNFAIPFMNYRMVLTRAFCYSA